MNPQEQIRQWWIYKITSPTGRVYIGRTINIKSRIRQHRGGSHKNLFAYRSIKKYGRDSHSYEIIDNFTSDNNYAAGKEIFWIRSYMANVRKYPEQNGMNLSDGGEGSFGAKHTEEWKKQNSLRHKGNKYNLGRKLTEAQKQQKRVENLGKKVSDTSKIREANIKSRGRAIIQYDFSNNMIGEFTTTVEAVEKLNICGRTILDSLRGRKLAFKKCYFKYK